MEFIYAAMVQGMYIKENKILWQDEGLPVWVNTFELRKGMELRHEEVHSQNNNKGR